MNLLGGLQDPPIDPADLNSFIIAADEASATITTLDDHGGGGGGGGVGISPYFLGRM